MAHDSRADISDRAQRLLTLSDELKELSYLVQQHAASGLQLPDDLLKLPVIAQIVQVLDNEDKSVAFSLASSQEVRIFAIGEGLAGEMADYGWIENVDNGSRVWEMQEPKTTPAGGVAKNRKVDVVITLPAGNYKLRYKSDDSHAFDHWNSPPPDINFWGIAVYKKS